MKFVENMDGFQNERRPIQGRGWSAPVPLLRDERPWIRWPLDLCYRVPLYIIKFLLGLLVILYTSIATPAAALYRFLGGEFDGPSDQRLHQRLQRGQIFFITISVTLSGGVINNYAKALEISGPGGTLLAVAIVGIIAIAVMEGVSELVQCFPAPSAIVEYVKTFVDQDLGWVVGFAYYYTFGALFAVQMIAAAALSTFWSVPLSWQKFVFYFVCPVLILIINFQNVWIFGLIEMIGGILTTCFLFGCSILLYVIAAREYSSTSEHPIKDGFTNNISFATSKTTAICYVIPLVAFCFVGLETVAVTAFEAKYSHSLRRPSQIMAYVVFALYFIYTLGQVLNVKWTPIDPTLFGGFSLVIVATWQADSSHIANFLNACLVFSLLFSSTTCLYIASRTLYGLANDVPNNSAIGRILHKLASGVRRTGAPVSAVLLSFLMFVCILYIQLSPESGEQDVIIIIAYSASVSCIIVWASLSLAFIRYEQWHRHFDKDIPPNYLHYKRKSREYKAATALGWAQPWPAYIGFLGSIMILIFTSAMWWNSPATFTKVAMACGAPLVLFLIFTVLKLVNRRWFIRRPPNIEVFLRELDRLRWLKQDEIQQQEREEMELRAHRAISQSSSVRRDPDQVNSGQVAIEDVESGPPNLELSVVQRASSEQTQQRDLSADSQ